MKGSNQWKSKIKLLSPLWHFFYLLFVKPCDQETSRNRTRRILRLPVSPQDSPCPDLVQSEPCILNSTCFTHQYRVSGRIVCTAGCHWPHLPPLLRTGIFPVAMVDYVLCVCIVAWSTCQLGENAVCGEGFRLRLLDCIRSDGKVVESRMCEQVTNAKTLRIRMEARNASFHRYWAPVFHLPPWARMSFHFHDAPLSLTHTSFSLLPRRVERRITWSDIIHSRNTWNHAGLQPVLTSLLVFLQLGLVNKWTLSESCVVDCPISCILSDWTPWTECSRTCGSQGKQTEPKIQHLLSCWVVHEYIRMH